MNEKWLRGCKTDKEKEDRRKEVLNYRNAFDDLTKILEEHFLNEVSPDFSKPGWEGELAHKHGARAKTLEILRLINLKD